jgi:predicted XRE-type DNA-binding protein
MISLRKLIRSPLAQAKLSNQWSLEKAAFQLQTTNDQVEELMSGDIDRFQVELLITMLSHAGMRVRVEIVAAA